MEFLEGACLSGLPGHKRHFCWTVSGPSAGGFRGLADAQLALVDYCAEDIVPSLQECCFWGRAAWLAGQEMGNGLVTSQPFNGALKYLCRHREL